MKRQINPARLLGLVVAILGFILVSAIPGHGQDQSTNEPDYYLFPAAASLAETGPHAQCDHL